MVDITIEPKYFLYIAADTDYFELSNAEHETIVHIKRDVITDETVQSIANIIKGLLESRLL